MMDISEIINGEKYIKVKLVGQGSYGEVWKCKHVDSEIVFAMKKIKLDDADLSPIQREILILKEVENHEKLVKFLGVKLVDNQVLIFTEFVEKGSLRDIIVKDGVFTEQQAAKYTKGTLEGLEFLHQKQIIHRDIKCGNILLDTNDNVKLADFGLSKYVENKSQMENHTFCGTLSFMAPEILQKTPYSSSVDIWALGVTVVEMLTGFPIFNNFPPMAVVLKILTAEKIETNIDNETKELKYFFQLTFTRDPKKRPKAQDLLRCKFVLQN